MSRRHVFLGIFLLLFLFLLFQLVLIFRPFLAPIFWAVILASTTYPLHRRLLAGTRDRRGLTAILSTLLVTILVIAPAVYLVVLALQESTEVMQWIDLAIKGGQFRELGEAVSEVPTMGHLGQEVIGRFIVSHSGLQTSVLEGSRAISAFLAEQGPDLAKNTVLFGIDCLLMLFTLFFLYRDGDDLLARLHRIIPLEDEHKDQIFARLNRTIASVVRGTLLTALAQGAVAGTIYWSLGVNYAVLLGALSAVVALLPVGGTAIVWIPVALFFVAQGAIMKAFIMILAGTLLVGFMDNILWPILVGRGAKLPMLFLFFASLGGMSSFGFVGLFVGPVLLAVVIEGLKIYEDTLHADDPDKKIVKAS